jgi:hypothetical protein
LLSQHGGSFCNFEQLRLLSSDREISQDNRSYWIRHLTILILPVRYRGRPFEHFSSPDLCPASRSESKSHQESQPRKRCILVSCVLSDPSLHFRNIRSDVAPTPMSLKLHHQILSDRSRTEPLTLDLHQLRFQIRLISTPSCSFNCLTYFT